MHITPKDSVSYLRILVTVLNALLITCSILIIGSISMQQIMKHDEFT